MTIENGKYSPSAGFKTEGTMWRRGVMFFLLLLILSFFFDFIVIIGFIVIIVIIDFIRFIGFITFITFIEEFWTNFLVQNRSGLLAGSHSGTVMK